MMTLEKETSPLEQQQNLPLPVGMQISQIDNLRQFDELKSDWERVYAADAQAHIFVSWVWLRGWFEMTPYNWFVLALRPDNKSPYVAFFPLIMRGLRIYKFRPTRILHMGGQPLATYTGFICSPEYEDLALQTFAHYIQQQLNWDSFQMEEVLDPRLDFLLKRFPQKGFDVQQSHGMPTLHIRLPDSWDDYLQNFLGPKTRRNLRRSFRQVEGNHGYQLSYTQADNLERDIETLLTFWQWRWGPKPVAHWRRDVIRYFFNHNSLWFGILWHESSPIAALAALTDRTKKTFYPYVVGYNPQYANLSPGKVVFGYSIKYAIENGFQIYDFLTGDDIYKYSFSPEQRATTNVVIMRKGLRSSIANIVINLTRQSGILLIKILGKAKRMTPVKKMWFWSRTLIKGVDGARKR